MMGFNYRFNPLYQSAREVVRSGRLGELTAVRSVFSTVSRQQPEWKKTRQTGGGALLDMGSHHIDLLHHIFGQPVRQVAATVRSQQAEADSTALTLTLADGLIVQSFFSTCAVEEDRFEVYGSAGKLALNRYLSLNVEVSEPTMAGARVKALRRQLGLLAHAPHVARKLLAPGHEPSYEIAFTRFVAAVREGGPVGPDFDDGLRAQRVIAAAEETAKTGRVITLAESEAGCDTP
jgi:predicted dehydrogenase